MSDHRDAENEGLADLVSHVERMRAGGWSRNANFAEHNQPSVAHARRLHRWLRSIERDLGRCDRVAVEQIGGEAELRLASAELRLERRVRIAVPLYESLAKLVALPPLSK